jgi:glycosyltransferase involved in cell wall biosynthesis
VPFGVDVQSFRPRAEEPRDDVVSVGADPHRDFGLLVGVASRLPETSFRIVTTPDHVRALPPLPRNVAIETALPFDEMRARLAGARIVALPMRENSYSGATTVLLQSLALGKPVVVTRTQAIATGYGLVDGENCRLVPPGDGNAFERALVDLLGDEERARTLGEAARETVVRGLSRDRWIDRVEELLLAAAGAPRGARSPRA